MRGSKGKAAPADGMFDLHGRVALVTGGGIGLGRTFSEALAEFGAHVVVADIDEPLAHETARLVEKRGGKSLVVKADVSRTDDVERMALQVVEELGAIDILVNNAGITARGRRIHEMPVEDFDRVIAVDLRGVFLCTRAVLPSMLKRGRGTIINIASVYGMRAFFEMGSMKPNAPYISAKAGVIGFTKETAIEYARDGIRANCIAPGWIQGTRLTAGMQAPGNEELLKRYDETLQRITPMGRKGDPDDLKGLIVYLASDASRFITGQVFVIDGGISV
jgi:NAD(P)-dependent dehydrogenase (short-subunit alcohol dehydrogenase family)